MVRALAQQLRPLLVQLNSFASGQAFAQYAMPAVAVPQSGGLFGSKRVTTPMSEPLPGVNLPNVTSPKAPELKVRSSMADHSGRTPLHAVECSRAEAAQPNRGLGCSPPADQVGGRGPNRPASLFKP